MQQLSIKTILLKYCIWLNNSQLISHIKLIKNVKKTCHVYLKVLLIMNRMYMKYAIYQLVDWSSTINYQSTNKSC